MIPSSKIFARIPRHFVQILFQTPFVRYSIKKLFLTKNIYISTFLLQKLEIFERDRLFPANEQCDISFVTSPFLREPSLRQAGREKKSDRCSSSLPRDDHFHRWREERSKKHRGCRKKPQRRVFFGRRNSACLREFTRSRTSAGARPGETAWVDVQPCCCTPPPSTGHLLSRSPFPFPSLSPSPHRFLPFERERDKDCTRVDNEKIEVSRNKG